MIWGKLPECNFKTFKNHQSELSQKSPKPQCDYWLIIRSQQKLHIEANIVLIAANHKSARGNNKTE